uniref:Uncharacterized protein n=1 Tax=Rhizophora mucronata TaxID=61149 RepID=A0A2P2J435_RHIMU
MKFLTGCLSIVLQTWDIVYGCLKSASFDCVYNCKMVV